MKTRILSSVVLVPLLLAILLVAPKVLTAVLFAVLAALAAYELLYNTGLVRHTRLLIYTAVMAFLVPIWCYYGMPAVWAHAGILLFFVLLFMEMMMSHIKLRFEKVAICVVGGLLIPYLLANPVRLLTAAGGRYLVMLPFVAAFLGDTGAYFIGCKFGQRKLAPVISPNKSVEGVIGSILFAVVGMIVYTMIMQLGFHHKVKPVTGQQKRVCRTLLWAGKRRHVRGITEAHAAWMMLQSKVCQRRDNEDHFSF